MYIIIFILIVIIVFTLFNKSEISSKDLKIKVAKIQTSTKTDIKKQIHHSKQRQQRLAFQNTRSANTKIDQKLQVIQENLSHLKDFLKVQFDELENLSVKNAHKRNYSDLIQNARLGSINRIQ